MRLNCTHSPLIASMPKKKLTDDELDVRNIIGGVWGSEPVTDVPSYILTQWSIISVPDLKDPEKREYHFIGYNHAGREGRVSSHIVNFDRASMKGVTRSGRVYELRGKAGYNSDADYVFGQWLRLNGLLWADVKLVDLADLQVPNAEGND